MGGIVEKKKTREIEKLSDQISDFDKYLAAKDEELCCKAVEHEALITDNLYKLNQLESQHKSALDQLNDEILELKSKYYKQFENNGTDCIKPEQPGAQIEALTDKISSLDNEIIEKNEKIDELTTQNCEYQEKINQNALKICELETALNSQIEAKDAEIAAIVNEHENKFANYEQESNENTQSLNNMIAEKDVEIDRLIAEYEAKIGDCNNELAESKLLLKNSVEQHQVQLEELKFASNKQSEQQLDESQKTQTTQFENYEIKIAENESEISELKSKIDEQENQFNQKLDHCSSEIESYQMKLNECELKISELNIQIESKEAEIAKVVTEHEKIFADYDQESSAKIQSLINELNQNKTQFEEEKNELNSKLDHYTAEIKNYQININENELKISDLKTMLNSQIESKEAEYAALVDEREKKSPNMIKSLTRE